MGDMEDGKGAAVAVLAAAAGLLIGANLGKIGVALRPVGQWIRKTAGAAYGGAAKFVLKRKEALEDAIAQARVKTAVQAE